MSKTIKLPAHIGYKILRKHKDFKLDFFIGSGPGGQARNKRKTAVRITDKITGLSAESQDATGQDDNKKQAFERLVQKMIKHYENEHRDATIKELLPEGSIRTYKLTKGIVIDHRTNETYNSDSVLNGKLNEIHEDILLKKDETIR